MGAIAYEDVVPESLAPDRTRYMTWTGHLMLVVVDFRDGPAVDPDPPHSHPHEQVSYVAEGEVLFFIDGVPTRLGPGGVASIPPDVPHCIQTLTSYARLVDVFTPIREDFLPK